MARIAVIGSGFSGTVLSSQLLRHGSSLQIHLIDQSGIFGPGVAYGTQDPSHILNVPAGDMGAFPDEPEHFYRWLKPRRPQTAATDFVERSWYGQYLAELLLESQRLKKAGNRLLRYKEAAVQADPQADGSVNLCLQSGKILNCDYVVLAIGNIPSALRQPFAALTDSSRYIRHFWNSPTWKGMDPKARILIVGTGLSMVDAVLSCEKSGHQGSLHAISRRGLLPRVHARVPNATFALPEGPCTVRQLLQWMRSQSRAQENPEGWIAVMNYLRPRVNELWLHLSAEERQRFTRHASPFWDVHRHRMPPSSAQVLDGMRAERRLDVSAGKVLKVEETDRGLRVLLKKRRAETMQLEVDYLLDCSGSERSIRQLPSPLVQSLLSQGLLVPDALGMGVTADADGRCRTQSQAAGPIFAIGPILRGVLWETSAVRELRIQCQSTAQALLKNVEAEPRPYARAAASLSLSSP